MTEDTQLVMRRNIIYFIGNSNWNQSVLNFGIYVHMCII